MVFGLKAIIRPLKKDMKAFFNMGVFAQRKDGFKREQRPTADNILNYVTWDE